MRMIPVLVIESDRSDVADAPGRRIGYCRSEIGARRIVRREWPGRYRLVDLDDRYVVQLLVPQAGEHPLPQVNRPAVRRV